MGSPDTDSVTTAQIVVVLKKLHERSVSQFDLMIRTREIVRRYPELRVSVDQPPELSGTGFRSAEVVYNVQGPDLDVLERLSNQVRDIMASTPGIVDIDTTSEPGKPEVQVHINRAKAADLGVAPADIALSLRTMLTGDKVTTFKDGTDLYDVRLRLQESRPRGCAGVRAAAGAVEQARTRASGQRGGHGARHGTGGDRPAQPRAPDHLAGQHGAGVPARRRAARGGPARRSNSASRPATTPA